MDIQCVPASILGIITIIIAGILPIMYPAWDSKTKDSNGRPNKPRHEKWFYAWLIGLSTLGGFWALFLPLALNQKFDGPNADGNQLRLHLLYITGGVLALTTLGETHRKNTVDREKAKVEKDNYEKSQNHQENVLKEQQRQFNETIAKERERIEIDKAKNGLDHIRQVHAERRSRYTKAIEHLFNENISVRLGSVYALAGLADEWLTDEMTLPIEKERRKEGQVIINTLCSYIRSSFNLASKTEDLSRDQTPEDYEGGDQQFTKDRAKLREEKELRLAILEAIKTRLNGGTNVQEDGTNKLLKGLWSDFDYDFSNAIFFYPLGFTNSYFGASSKFSGATFTENADFSKTAFTERAPFSGATFTCAHFYEATFTERAPFSGATFTQDANFFKAKFTKDADFSGAEFTQGADFSGATFTQEADFSGATFTQEANFFRTIFIQDAKFAGTVFTRDADFSGATFTQEADFSGATFTKNATFYGVTFTQEADFSRATFTLNTNFSKATFQTTPIFEYTLNNETYKARFSYKTDPEDYNFEVSPDSLYKIETREQEHNGVKFIIPEDAMLFDPDNPFAWAGPAGG